MHPAIAICALTARRLQPAPIRSSPTDDRSTPANRHRCRDRRNFSPAGRRPPPAAKGSPMTISNHIGRTTAPSSLQAPTPTRVQRRGFLARGRARALVRQGHGLRPPLPRALSVDCTRRRRAASSTAGWQTPDGALALVLLLDQFPRNAFRGTPRMYATDAKARQHRRCGARRRARPGRGTALRLFFYLPFGHSESLADQERSVALGEAPRRARSVARQAASRHHPPLRPLPAPQSDPRDAR